MADERRMPRWFPWALLLIILVAAAWLAIRLALLFVVVAMSLLVALSLLPAVRWLERRGCSRMVSLGICYGTLLVLVTLGAVYLVPLIVHQAQQFVRVAPGIARRLTPIWTAWQTRLPFLGGALATLVAGARGQAGAWVKETIGLTEHIALVFAEAITVLVLAFFFLKDGPQLERRLLVLVPPRRRAPIPAILEASAERVGAWAFGQVILMAVVGVSTAIGLALIGVPFSILLGVTAGILKVVPFIGPVLTAVACLLAAASVSWVTVLWTGGFLALLLLIADHVIQPLVLSKTVGLHPIWVILALIAGGLLGGVAGLILAVPVAATVKILVEELYLPRIAAQERALLPADGEEPPAAA